ncbi:DeoR family transcriptional regulator [Candidatus Dojkabacteria bacterium]|nr:DeoR family transcriptional regulator [Candidatus Dojkabacteria bacterium]
MKQIFYYISNQVLNNIIQLEVTRTELKKFEIQAEMLRKLEEESFIENMLHTSNMLGLQQTYKDAEKFSEMKIEIGNDTSKHILNNFRNVLEYLKSNETNNYIDINVNMLIHVNKFLINGWKEEWEAGLRNDNKINLMYDDWGEFIDNSIVLTNIHYETQENIDWYKNNITRIHPLLRISVLIYRLIRITPFRNLNKLSLIAISHFLLQKNRYFYNSPLSMSKIFDKNNTLLQNSLKTCLNDENENITAWIEVFTDAITTEYKELLIKVQQSNESTIKNEEKPFLDLNKRQLKILRYLQSIPTVKREDYIQMFDVSTMTAYRDLNALVKKKLLRIEGEGRATHYKLANR